MSEKLLSQSEAAKYLRVSEEAIRGLVEAGHIPAYKIGGVYLRFKKDQLDSVKDWIAELSHKENSAEFTPSIAQAVVTENSPRSYLKGMNKVSTDVEKYDYSTIEKIKDFFYFNDFYIIFSTIVVILLVIIFKS